MQNRTSVVASVGNCLLAFWPVWLLWLLLPLPTVLFWHSQNGRFLALCCFFVSCVSFVVFAFHKGFVRLSTQRTSAERKHTTEVWRYRISFLWTVLLFQWGVFSVLCLAFNDSRDFIAPVLALLSLIPALCIAPYITLATQKPFASVVFTLFLVGCMKLVAGSVTVLVYGWEASAHGHTVLAWTQPNLIVCSLIVATTVLSASFYILGRRRFFLLHGGVT